MLGSVKHVARHKSNSRKTDRQDAKAWGIVFSGVDRALRLAVSAETRRLLLRCRFLIAHLAERTPLGVAKEKGREAAQQSEGTVRTAAHDSPSDGGTDHPEGAPRRGRLAVITAPAGSSETPTE
jgi:hypothetical protein